MKVLPTQIRTPEDIGALEVRTPSGQMVRLDSVVEIRHGVGPININRSDRERSVLLTGNLEGIPLNRALETVNQVLAEELPEGYRAKATGQAEEFADAMNALLFAIGLAILIVYMLLASQFNSLLHPFTIMLALPPAMTGALLGLWLTGHTINIMSVIGIILLFGLVTKNSILLVDLTIQRQQQGMDRETALRTACPIRLRPILMTALSMIFGVLPVALALGEGGEARAPMAVATAGGMITSTVMTLYVVPVVYSYMDRLSARLVGRRARKAAAEAESVGIEQGTCSSTFQIPRRGFDCAFEAPERRRAESTTRNSSERQPRLMLTLRRLVGDDDAIADLDDPRRPPGQVHVVGDHHQGAALLPELAEQAHDVAPDPVSRLPVGSSARTMSGSMARARAMATRCIWPPDSSVGLCSIRSARPTWSSCSQRALAALATTDAAEQQRHLDVLERGELRQQVEVLEHEADPPVADVGELVAVEARHRLAAQAVVAAGRRVEAADQVHQRRLARAGGTDHRDELALADGQVDAAQRLDLDLAGVVDLADRLPCR